MVKEEVKTGFSAADRPWLGFYDADIINEELPNGSLYDYMHSQNLDRMGETAISFMGRKLTHCEFDAKIKECARALTAHGVKKGDVVSVCILTSPEALILLYAINLIGAVSNFLIISNTADDLAAQISAVGSKLVFANDIVSGKLNDACTKAKVDGLVCVPLAYSMPLATALIFKYKTRKSKKYGIAWSEFLKKGKGTAIPEVDVRADDLAVLEYTSGTTGTPKAAMLSNISCNAVAFNYIHSDTVFEFHKGESFLGIIPPFYSIGLVTTLLMPLCTGFRLILSPDPDPTKTAGYIRKYKPNHFCGGPLHIDNIVNDKKLHKADLSFIKTLAYGGEKSDSGWEKKASDFFKSHGMEFELVNGYGLTETSGSFCTTAHHCGNMIPFAKNNVMILDIDTGKELGYDCEGEICLSGPSLMMGYYNNREATDNVMMEKDGARWLKTGDLGVVSADGSVRVTGRIKRILWSLDDDNVVYRIFPMHIEEEISTCPCVHRCAVVGLPDKNRGYLPVAYVVLDYNADASKAKEDILTVCRQKLNNASVPYAIHFVDKLPKTTAGKIDFKALEQQAISEHNVSEVSYKK